MESEGFPDTFTQYYALRKEHDTYRNGVEDAFFADDTFEIVD